MLLGLLFSNTHCDQKINQTQNRNNKDETKYGQLPPHFN